MIRTVFSSCFRTNYERFFISKRNFKIGHYNASLGLESIQRPAYKILSVDANLGENSVQVRRATLSDYNTVISIPRHAKTFDSLPDRYCAFISCQTNAGYVAKVNGTDAGFQLTYQVDNGETLFLDELRVINDEDVKTIQEAILKFINATNPHTRLISLCAHDSLLTKVDADVRKPSDWRVVTKRVQGTFETNMANLLKSLRSTGTTLKSAKRLCNQGIMKIMSSPGLYHTLLKDDRILKSNILYQPISSNIPLIMDKRTLVIGSNITDDKTALVSIGTYSHTKQGLHYSLSFHGNTDMSLEEHLLIHKMSLLNRSSLNITFDVFAYEDHNMCQIVPIMKSFCLPTDNNTYKNLTWYETRI